MDNTGTRTFMIELHRLYFSCVIMLFMSSFVHVFMSIHLQNPSCSAVLCNVPTPSVGLWKVLENDFGPGKSWKFKLKVPESPGICLDVDAMMRTQMQKYSRPHSSSSRDSFLQ